MVYQYKCRVCETVFDVEHSMSVNDAVAELGTSCPNCESPDVFKYLGNLKTAYIQFKGVGFAKNDLALDKIGFPKHYHQNPEIRQKLNKTVG